MVFSYEWMADGLPVMNKGAAGEIRSGRKLLSDPNACGDKKMAEDQQ
jgi:hypothetical protein